MPDAKWWRERWGVSSAMGKPYSVNREWCPECQKAELEELMRGLDTVMGDAAPTQSVLDYGCGEARFLSWFEAHGYIYCGADIVPELLDENRSKHNDVMFLSIEDLNPGLVPDWLFMSMVVQHLTIEECLAVFRKILSPNVVIIDNSETKGPDYVTYRTQEEIKEILEVGGWSGVECRRIKTPRSDYKIVSARDRQAIS